MSQHKGSLACSSYSQRVGLTTRNLHVDSELTKSLFGPPSNLLETQFSQISHHRNYWKHIVILYCFFFVFFLLFPILFLCTYCVLYLITERETVWKTNETNETKQNRNRESYLVFKLKNIGFISNMLTTLVFVLSKFREEEV